MSVGFTIKVKAEYEDGIGWTLTTKNPNHTIVAHEYTEAFDEIVKLVKSDITNGIASQNRVSLVAGEIKASASFEIDESELTRSFIEIPMDEVRISTALHVSFTPNRSLDEFSMGKVLDKAADVVNSGALDGDGYTCTVTTHKAGGAE